MGSDILNKLRTEIERRAEAQKAQIDSEANMLCLCAEILLNAQAETSTRIVKEIAPTPSDKRELTVKELAAIWRVSTRSIYEWKTTGGLPFKKHGRLLRFDWIEADRWAKQHREAFGKVRLRGKVTPLQAAATN
jgi:excisionase family DNA binding protein